MRRAVLLVFAVLAVHVVAGCEHAWRATFYNVSGRDLVLTLDRTPVRLPPDSKWYGKYGVLRRGELVHPQFTARSGGTVWAYPKKFGPAGCSGFPTAGLCNTFRIEPDMSVTYVGGHDIDRATGRSPPPARVPQPPNFPLRPQVETVGDASGYAGFAIRADAPARTDLVGAPAQQSASPRITGS